MLKFFSFKVGFSDLWQSSERLFENWIFFFGLVRKLISLRANDLNRISFDSAEAAAAQIYYWNKLPF
jgi:hypothetical protein